MNNNMASTTLKIPEPAPTMDHITNVDEMVDNYQKEHYAKPTRRAFLIILAAEVIFFLYLILTAQFNPLWLALIFFLPMPFIILDQKINKLYQQLKHEFVKQFALSKGLTYQPIVQLLNIKGEFFSEYHISPLYLDVISGIYN